MSFTSIVNGPSDSTPLSTGDKRLFAEPGARQPGRRRAPAPPGLLIDFLPSSPGHVSGFLISNVRVGP